MKKRMLFKSNNAVVTGSKNTVAGIGVQIGTGAILTK